MVDAAFKEKANTLLNLADADPHGYLGRLTMDQQADLDQLRKLVNSKVRRAAVDLTAIRVDEKIWGSALSGG